MTPKLSIGISAPLTIDSGIDSDVRGVGHDVCNAVKISCELLDLNCPINIQDNRYDKVRTEETIQRLHELGSTAVIGLPTSNEVLYASKALADTGLVGLTSMATSPRLADFREVFRTRPSDAHATKLLARYIAQQGYHRIGVLSEDTAYSWDCAESLMKHLETNGISSFSRKIQTHSHIHDPSVTHLALEELKSNNIDALFINSQDEEALFHFVKHSRKLVGEIPILGSAMPGSRKFQDMAGEVAYGITYVAPVASAKEHTPTGQTLLSRFREQFGEPQTGEYAVIYTFAAVYALACASQGDDSLHNNLSNMSFQSPVNGQFRFNEREIEYLFEAAPASSSQKTQETPQDGPQHRRVRVVQITQSGLHDLNCSA